MIPITQPLQNKEILAATQLIQQAERVAIFTHVSPDGDAIGSSLGMLHYLHALGKQEVKIIVPNDFPQFLKWMSGIEYILYFDKQPAEAEAFVKAADLLICLDFNEPKRISEAAFLLEQKGKGTLMIDHHLHPANFADVTISYPESPSTCELVLRLICHMGNEQMIGKSMAECLLAGMMTDTENYSFSANSPDSYRMVALLLEKGVNKTEIYNRLFHSLSSSAFHLRGYCMQRVQIDPEYHAALLVLTKNEIQRFNVQKGDTEGIVNLPFLMEGIYYSCLIREDGEKIKISFRSVGNDRPVNILAHDHFGGGGHKNAAGGGDCFLTLHAAVECYRQHYRQYYKKD